MTLDPRPCVLVLAGGADWEAGALAALAAAGVVVVRRCVDVADLMAAAGTGSASIAVVAAEVPRLDAEAVAHLLRHDVRTLAVSTDPGERERLERIGAGATTTPADIPDSVLRIAARDPAADVLPPEDQARRARPPRGRHLDAEVPPEGGRVVAVWGPAGAPGRTTVATALAGEVAACGRPAVLVDADPYGGTVAQHLGVLDEVSGLLAAARMANLGTLDATELARACRVVSGRLEVLTGLPRADRRVEVRPGVLPAVLELAAGRGEVVVDCGFSLEDDGPTGRDRMTLDVLECADEVVVVGSAEPTGLARLARGLVELREAFPAAPLRVVVNRMRSSLGWREREVVGMVEGYAGAVPVHLLPADGAILDRALVSGRVLSELGESRLREAVSELARATFPAVGLSRASARARRRSGSSPAAATG